MLIQEVDLEDAMSCPIVRLSLEERQQLERLWEQTIVIDETACRSGDLAVASWRG
jgi:hypothetical protein